MNKSVCLVFFTFFTVFLYAASMDWGTGKPGFKVVTNEEDRAALKVIETNRVTVVYNPTNANEWTSGDGRRMRASLVPEANLTMWDQQLSSWGTVVLVPNTNELPEVSWDDADPNDPLGYTYTWVADENDGLGIGVVYAMAEGSGASQNPAWCLPAEKDTWPKTYTRENGMTGWVNRASTLITNELPRVAHLSDLAAAARFHADSYTNLIWVEVFSNGWPHYEAYTNTLNFLVP